MAQKKSIYSPYAARKKEGKEPEKLLAGYSPKVIAAVLGKREDLDLLIPRKQKQENKLVKMLKEYGPRPRCPVCGSLEHHGNGYDENDYPRYICLSCGKNYGAQTNTILILK